MGKYSPGREHFRIPRERLAQAGLSIAALSDLCGLSYKRVYKLASGGAGATPDEMLLITRVLNVAVGFEAMRKGSR